MAGARVYTGLTGLRRVHDGGGVRGFGELEAVIMDRVWEHAEPVTVRELHGELSAGRVIAYTTPALSADREGCLC